MSHPSAKTILLLAANPKGTSPLRLDQEVRDIHERLQRSQYRNTFRLEQRWAVRPRDVQLAILEVNPQIIHFSGHGFGETGLAFEDESGRVKLVEAAALAGLFELFADQIECVILNACYSEVQADAIAQYIPCVIGMNQDIGDRAALEFAVGFYDALGAGRSVEFAYKLGCSAIRMAGIAEHLTPVLKQNAGVTLPPPTSQTSPKHLSVTQKRRLEQKRNALQAEFDLRSEKLQQLRASLAIETSPAIKFQLEKQIQTEEVELAKLDSELAAIDTDE